MLDDIPLNHDVLLDAYQVLPIGILVVNRAGSIVAANPYLERLLGYSPFELHGKPIECLVPESSELRHRELRREYTRQASARPMGAGRELVAKHRDGRCIPVEIGLTPLVRGSEEVVVCTVSGVSERKELQAQLHVVQREVAIGNVVGGIAHDFNNILSGVLGYAALCKELAGSDRELQDYLDELLAILQSGREFVTSILDLASNRPAARRLIRWEGVIDGVIRLLRLTLPADVHILVSPGENVPEVLADPVELQRILVNLLTNAIHASANRGGTIEIRVDVSHFQPTARKRGPELLLGRYVRLSVIDQGVGIPLGVLERVFLPHFTTRATEGGRGIGLFATSRIVKSLEGSIDITSLEGEGTRVDVYLPVADEKTPEADDNHERPSTPGQSRPEG